jgi:hypothetical protein
MALTVGSQREQVRDTKRSPAKGDREQAGNNRQHGAQFSGYLLHRRLLNVLAALVLLVACSDDMATQQVNWTPAQREVFKAFRTSSSKDRVSLAREVVDVLPHVLDFGTLTIRRADGALPTQSDVLDQLGAPANSFALDRYPGYMGGRVAPTVNRRDYRVHIYEVGCYQRAAPPSEGEVLCGTLELVAFREHVVAAFIAHDTPESVRHWLSVR